MLGLFWELLGLSSTFGRQPGYGIGGQAAPNALRLIHQGCLEFAKRVKPVQLNKLFTFSVVASQELYPLPDDFLAYKPTIKEPMEIAGRKLRMTTQGEIEQLRDLPTHAYLNCFSAWWYEAGVDDSGDSNANKRLFGLYPVPIANGTGKLPYLRKPRRLDAATVVADAEYPDLPEAYHQSPVFWAAAEFYKRQPEVPRSVDPQTYEARFMADVELLRQEEELNLTQNTPTIPMPISGMIRRQFPV